MLPSFIPLPIYLGMSLLFDSFHDGNLIDRSGFALIGDCHRASHARGEVSRKSADEIVGCRDAWRREADGVGFAWPEHLRVRENLRLLIGRNEIGLRVSEAGFHKLGRVRIPGEHRKYMPHRREQATTINAVKVVIENLNSFIGFTRLNESPGTARLFRSQRMERTRTLRLVTLKQLIAVPGIILRRVRVANVRAG